MTGRPPARRATYRLQLTPQFGFDQAAALAPYLARLGVSHLYTSPYLQAAPGSTHGYDVVDHGRVNRELGGEPAHQRMLEALRAQQLGHIIDVVPNHMAIASRENRWWRDVLAHGQSSPYASYFDVDWYPPEERLRNVILLPVLRDHYGRVLEAGEITLVREGADFTIRYGEHVFPLDPRSLAGPLREAARRATSDRLAFMADVLEDLPVGAREPEAADRLYRGGRGAFEILHRLLAEQPGVAQSIDAVVAELNADYDQLDRLLDAQHYRLAAWQAAGRDLGYRRFFDVNSLIGLNAERERVFRDTHRLVLAWLAAGSVDGLRIDHPDGLRDPEQYLRRLAGAFPGVYVVVEKVLVPGERLPAAWPVAGTTGYEFLNAVLGLFVDPAAEAPLTAFYGELTGEPADFQAIKHDCTILVLREQLGSDVNRLAELLLQVCERHRRHRDYTRHQVTEAVRELLADFPVYRTYARPAAGEVRDEDRRVIAAAIERAKAARADLDPALFDFLEALLTLRAAGQLEGEFVSRFQQLGGPAMAKGVEDTALYRFNRFVALNEVGGDPARFGVAPDDFHRQMAETFASHPQTMLTTATHDTKRGEDVRARLAVLSEIPERWTLAVRSWAAMNARYRTGDAPSRNDEYLLYQTLAGAWPIGEERVWRFMEKAAREARRHTSWTAPNAEYETALRRFVSGVMDDGSFTADLERFLGPVIPAGRTVSLAQTLLRLTAPGVPDLYQGTELWSHTLVDPDNRQPVDFALRQRLVDEVCTLTPEQILERAEEGLPKLWLIRRTLSFRAAHAYSFGVSPSAAYKPLAARGARKDHVVAFLRGEAVAVLVPRLAMRLGSRDPWGKTSIKLPGLGAWRNVLTDEPIENPVHLRDAFARFPVALLARG